MLFQFAVKLVFIIGWEEFNFVFKEKTLVVEKQQKILCCLEFHRDSQAGTERNGNTRSASRPVSDSFRHFFRISSASEKEKKDLVVVFFFGFVFCFLNYLVNVRHDLLDE